MLRTVRDTHVAWADRVHGALRRPRRVRFVGATMNGPIGDRLAREGPRLATPLAVRHQGRDVPLRPQAPAVAYPAATTRLALLLHGLSEDESAFDRHRDRTGTSYADTLSSPMPTGCTLPGAGPLGLLNQPQVHEALRTWLGGSGGEASAVGEQGPIPRGSVRRSG